ncbi:hypothetical protein FE257_003837 [Aspergillus nanangensis]|uniref:Uncharacterized protein n=1 Tax=Aspergillus nanangensis TaxID=2582783 RepID=A0AAD4GPE2_ASPNN|nr:hypothetical protein FE257_003837 [Aspergillus nanangensis]
MVELVPYFTADAATPELDLIGNRGTPESIRLNGSILCLCEDRKAVNRTGQQQLVHHPSPTGCSLAGCHQDDLKDELIRFTNNVTTINDAHVTPEPSLGDADPESSEYRKLIILKSNRHRAMLFRSSATVFVTDAPTIEDPNDEVCHEASERSDDEQLHQ